MVLWCQRCGNILKSDESWMLDTWCLHQPIDLTAERIHLLAIKEQYDEITQRQDEANTYFQQYLKGVPNTNIWHAILDDALKLRETMLRRYPGVRYGGGVARALRVERERYVSLRNAAEELRWALVEGLPITGNDVPSEPLENLQVILDAINEEEQANLRGEYHVQETHRLRPENLQDHHPG
jgi:hypothetical protein